jgi:hypothetical protein
MGSSSLVDTFATRLSAQPLSDRQYACTERVRPDLSTRE